MKENNKLTIIISSIIILIITVINLSVYINKVIIPAKRAEDVLIKYTYTERSVANDTKWTNNSNIEDLKSMTERERVEFYFSEFMDYIENGKYQEAYDLLYPEFKNNYFKTLDDFKKYVNKTYPDFVSFSYNDIDRQGYIYVLTIAVINPDLDKNEARKSQRIVIKENDFNNFVLSFQVI